MFALLLLANEIFGDPIDCGGGRGSIQKNSIDNFCWVMGIYVQKGFTGMYFYVLTMQKIFFDVFITGAITNKTKQFGYITGPINGERIYLHYYQWLVIIYLGMAASFSLPGIVWRAFEGNRIKSLGTELGKSFFFVIVQIICFF